MIWIVTGYGWMTEVGNRRWMTGDGFQEMDHERQMTINHLTFYDDSRICEVIPFSISLTLISSYEVAIERRYADSRCTAGSLVPASTIPTTI